MTRSAGVDKAFTEIAEGCGCFMFLAGLSVLLLTLWWLIAWEAFLHMIAEKFILSP